MTRTIQDLWPEDITASVPWPPVALLREQAGLLGPRTRGLVEAEVNTVTSGDNIIHHFELVAPALGGYRYRLFTVGHEVGLYPLWIEWEREELKADDEHALREHLATILS